MKKNAILLGIDPGFSNFGYAALCIAPPPSEAKRVISFGVFETEKAKKKQHVLATEDNLKRAREIADFLDSWIDAHGNDRNQVIAICAESMSWPRNAGVTAKMGITWGVVATVARAKRVPIFQASPQEIKKRTAGFKSATKEEIQAAIGNIPAVHGLGYCVREILANMPKGAREHPSDALACALVCSEAEAIQVARRGLAA
jgi:Holliday junction resolvasome RuvABC endonuclease subunit